MRFSLSGGRRNLLDVFLSAGRDGYHTTGFNIGRWKKSFPGVFNGCTSVSDLLCSKIDRETDWEKLRQAGVALSVDLSRLAWPATGGTSNLSDYLCKDSLDFHRSPGTGEPDLSVKSSASIDEVDIGPFCKVCWPAT